MRVAISHRQHGGKLSLFGGKSDWAWIVVGITALLIVILLAVANWRGIIQANRQATEYRADSAAIRRVLTLLDEAESGQRGYLLTGRERYLALYSRSLPRLASELSRLESHPSFHSYAAAQMRLSLLAREKLAELRETVRLRQTGQTTAALNLVQSDRGEELMEDLRSLIGDLQGQMNKEVANSSDKVAERAGQAAFVTSAACVVLFVLLNLTNLQLRRERRVAELANLAKSSFLASMSHELRTPLNAIIGYSEMLVEEAEETGQSSFVSDLNRIQVAGKHLLLSINSVLDLSKIEAGKMDLYVESFSIAGLIEEVAAVINPLALKNRNELRVDVEEGTGSIHTDQTKLRQTLYNLLSNACKFTSDGVVTLRAHRQVDGTGETLIFEIADTGIGMKPEQVQAVFLPFAQADSSTTRRFGGTGLGLALSHRFVKLMGGQISVQTKPGEGSTFTVSIPASASVFDSLHTQPAPMEIESPTEQVILAIDDEASVQDLLSRSLARNGFRVHSAYTGEEGLRLARKLRPAAITLDVMMPGMDGWTVLSIIKADAELCDIPVIMLSIADNRNLGYTLGATDYLTKPIDRDKLVSVLLRYQLAASSASALIVEDDADARHLLVRSLHAEGWKVNEAENGHAALMRIGESRPGIILLDLMMPEMDGFEFVAELRKLPEGRNIPIIVITAKDLTTDERSRLNGQVSRVLLKGAYEVTDLLAEVSRLVVTRVRPKTHRNAERTRDINS